MVTRLEAYQAFIDSFVRIRPCVLSRWIAENNLQVGSTAAQKYGALMAELTPEQRLLVAEIAQDGRDSGIHDVLAWLEDEINLRDLHLLQSNVELATNPYGSEMYYDGWCRICGDEYPEKPTKEEYM